MKPGLKYLLSAAVLLFASLVCNAQTTKVRGRVTDDTGEGVPFAAVYFAGTTVGITTDMDGYYNLENRDLSGMLGELEIFCSHQVMDGMALRNTILKKAISTTLPLPDTPFLLIGTLARFTSG